MLLVRNVTIEAGARTLLTDVSFSVQRGEKVGLVGPNGAGKTTMLRVLADGQQPAAGTVTRSGVIGYLPQEVALYEVDDQTALERILTARQIGDIERQIEQTRRAMEETSGEERDRLIRRFSRLGDEFSARGGYVAKAEAKRFASGLGIGVDELDQPVATMSGGQRRRVELARILFADTDTLILDEPTNHLDLDAKAWLMQFLAGYRGGVLVVSPTISLCSTRPLRRCSRPVTAASSRTVETIRSISSSASVVTSSASPSGSVETPRSHGSKRASGVSRDPARRWRRGHDRGKREWNGCKLNSSMWPARSGRST